MHGITDDKVLLIVLLIWLHFVMSSFGDYVVSS